jgi:hypothetical protein
MRKIVLGLVLALLLSGNAYANKAILLNTSVPVEKWVVQTISYHNQKAGFKVSESATSYFEAEEKSISQCENDKIFNSGKPEGCLVYKMTEIYQTSWRYFAGTKTLSPTEKTPGPDRIEIYKDSLDRKIKEAENKKIKELKENHIYFVKKREQEEKKDLARKQKIASLDMLYGNTCTGSTFKKGFTKGTKEYQNCLFAKEKEVFSQQKILDAKLAVMSADERRDYICENKFGFKKNSTKFQDCRFKLFTGEMELQKLQIQKELAQAKLEAAKASEAAAKATAQLAQSTQARQEALAQAQIQASQMQAAAAAVQAYAIQQQGAQEMMDRGLDMLSGRRGVDGSIRSAPSAPIINRQVCTSIVISRNPYTTREVCR